MKPRTVPCGAGLLAGSVDLRVDVAAHTAPLPQRRESCRAGTGARPYSLAGYYYT